MITKEYILELYCNCYKAINDDEEFDEEQYLEYSNQAYLEELADSEFVNDDDYTELPEMTQLQWNNLVEVCQTIVDNAPLFNMSSYHNRQGCGTTHCIAGWAVCMELNDYTLKDENYSEEVIEAIADKYDYEYDDLYSMTSSLASAILSPLIYPFFYLTGTGSNEILLDEFIKPILAIANND